MKWQFEMSLKFFADHCVPNAVIQALRNAGHQVFILREHIPRDSPDPVVIAKAQELNAILVSLNGDFADPISAGGGHVSLYTIVRLVLEAFWKQKN